MEAQKLTDWDKAYDAEADRIVLEFQTTGKADGLTPTHWDQNMCDEALDDIAAVLATGPQADDAAILRMIRERMTKLYNDLAYYDASRVADRAQDEVL